MGGHSDVSGSDTRVSAIGRLDVPAESIDDATIRAYMAHDALANQALSFDRRSTAGVAEHGRDGRRETFIADTRSERVSRSSATTGQAVSGSVVSEMLLVRASDRTQTATIV